MRIRAVALLVLLLLCASGCLRASAGENTLYTLGISLDQQEGIAGSWTGVGEKGAWKETIVGTILNGRLYTIESSGVLYETDLSTGTWKQIGKPEFGNTAFLFAANNALYTIETSGSLYRVNPVAGSWGKIGPAEAWKNTTAGAVLANQLYTTESNGALYVTDLATGDWKQIGPSEFGNTVALIAANKRLYAIQADGGLCSVNLGDGARTRIGPAQGWKRAIARAGMHDQLITAESNGALYVSSLTNGVRTSIGQHEFGNTKFMFAAGDGIYTIETDGSLYKVFLKPGVGIGEYDWCPQEVEKIFREQGQAFYHRLVPQQINGAQSTHLRIMEGFDALQKSVTKDDLVVIYIGCHGGTDPDKGWSVMTADGKILWGYEIKAALAKIPCQVLILVETCTSGGFALPHKDDPPLPSNVTALCACAPTQTTDNQLDMALAEGLYGRADFNKDGVVSLDELIHYIQQRYLEWWPTPQTTEGSQTPVIVKSTNLSGATPLTSVSPALAAVDHDGTLYSALLEGQNGPNYNVHLLGWSSQPGKPYFLTNQVPRDLICLPADGPPLLVEQGGKWLAARLLSQTDGKFKIHYLGTNQDETVTQDRIHYPFVGQKPGTH